MAAGYFVVQNGLQVGPLMIDAATGTIETSGNINLSGNLGVSSIQKGDSSIVINDTGSGSNITFTVDGIVEHVMTGTLTSLSTALTTTGNVVAGSGTASSSTTTGALVVVGGAGVSGNATIGGSAVITGDAYVQGGDIFTSATTFNLLNATATTVNAFGAATTLNTGNAGGTTNMAGIVKVGGNIVAASGTASTNFNLGALTVVGGAGITGAIYAGSVNSPVGNVTTLVAPNFSSSNTQVTGTGSYFGTGASLVNSVYGTTGYFTNFSSANIDAITNLDATTSVATNFSTGNAQITGTGSYFGTGASLVNSVYGTTGYFTNFSSANIDAITNLDATTSVATNFSTGNIVATGGSINNVTVGATTATTGRFTTVTATTLNAGTIGNVSASVIGATGRFDTSVTTSALSAATIGNTGATLTGTISTATQNSVTTMAGLVSLGSNNVDTVAQGNFTIAGNLTVQGVNQAIGSQNLTVADSIIELHTFANLAPLTSDDGRDIGIRFHYYKGADRNAVLIWENTTEQLHWYANAVETSSNISGTLGTLGVGELFAGNSTASTSTATGALRVTGGAGIGGVAQVGGNIVAASGTTSSSTTTGALVVVGGAGVSGALNVGGTSTVAAVTASGTVQPNANATVALGGASNYWSNFYAAAITTNGLTVGASGGILPAANLTVNIGSTSAWFNTFYGVSTQAKYADLAENYMGDKNYAPGTVLMFGGAQEVTLADAETTAVAGVVSTNPAHLMNGQLTGPNVIPLALQGRVPCMVVGPIKKGDMLVSAGFGYAKASANPLPGQVIGKALQDYASVSKAVIEVVVGRV